MIPLFILVIENEDDRAFMSNLYLTYNRLMYDQIFQIVHDKSITEDLLQDVLVNLIDRIGELQIKSRDHLVNYIISSCKNRAFNYLRGKRAHPETSIDLLLDMPDPLQNGTQIESFLIAKDEISRLARIWDRLNPRDQYILESYYIMEMSTHEIGQELGIKPDSVRMALTRARKTAYQLMEQQQ